MHWTTAQQVSTETPLESAEREERRGGDARCLGWYSVGWMNWRGKGKPDLILIFSSLSLLFSPSWKFGVQLYCYSKVAVALVSSPGKRLLRSSISSPLKLCYLDESWLLVKSLSLSSLLFRLLVWLVTCFEVISVQIDSTLVDQVPVNLNHQQR